MKEFTYSYELDVERLCRRLRIDGDGFSDRQSRDMIPALRKIAEENMEMRVWYREGAKEFKTGIPQVDSCEKQVVCLMYASRKIGHIMEEMTENGDYLECYILNDLSNDLLFNASNQLNKFLTETYEKQEKCLTQKFFPGEGEVPLETQKTLLDIMKEKNNLEVEINDSFMLTPEKSMLYAFGADSANEKRSWEHDCSLCNRTECMFRDKKDNDFCPE